jgi:hypothetical protein
MGQDGQTPCLVVGLVKFAQVLFVDFRRVSSQPKFSVN